MLGLFDVTVLAGAAMGPAYSLASTMGPMFGAGGPFAPLALAATSLIMLGIAAGFARLSEARPNAGSSYSWIAGAFGPFAGAYGAWLLLLSNYFATMATAVPAGIYSLDLFAPALAGSQVATALVGTLWILASAALLGFGLRPTALVTAAFFAIELLVLGASAVAAIAIPHPAESAALGSSSAPGVPPASFGGIVGAIVLGVWMTDGWEVSASTAEETSGPPQTAGRGGIAGLLITCAILLAAMAAYAHLAGAAGLAQHSTDALTYVAERLGGGGWRIAIVTTVLVSTAATLWTTMLYLSRSVFAMGRDGVVPAALGRLDGRGVPRGALLAVTALVALCTLGTGFSPSVKVALDLVLNGTSAFLGLLFAGSTAALLRERPVGLAGAVAIVAAALLLGLVALSVAWSDALTRSVELGGLALGLPFALWRSLRRYPRAAGPNTRR